MTTEMSRRDFAKLLFSGALAGSGACVGESPTAVQDGVVPSRPVRVTGRVHSAGTGVAGVAISDGQGVVTTDREGVFDIVTDASREFVSFAPPPGFLCPTDPSGFGRLFARIPFATRGSRLEIPLTRAPESQDRHTIVLLGDVQVEQPQDVLDLRENFLPDFHASVSRIEGATIVVAVGDMLFDVPDLLSPYAACMSQLDLPILHVLGNHDRDPRVHPESMKALFTRSFGPTYYSFNIGEIHYIVLDTIEFTGDGWFVAMLGATQLAWLRNDLRHVDDGRTVVVIGHVPLQTWEPTSQQAFQEIMTPFNVHYFCGHWHLVSNEMLGPVRQSVVGAVCGAWWSGAVCIDGAPKGYMVLDAQGSEIIHRYKTIGRDPGHQLRIYPPGESQVTKVNVWNWDQRWTLRAWIDGLPTEPPKQRGGLDPLALALYEGPDNPSRSPWIEPNRTAHLFEVAVPLGWTEVTVVATDPWGSDHSDTLLNQTPLNRTRGR